MAALLVVDGNALAPFSPLGESLAQAARARGWTVAHSRLATAGPPLPALIAVRGLIRAASPLERPVLVVLGTEAEQSRLIRALVAAGLRPQVRIVLHVPAALVPLEPRVVESFRFVDLVVTDSAFGERAVEQGYADASATRRTSIERIEPFVAVPGDDRPTSLDRRRLRRERFGLDDHHLLIVCETTTRPAPALALHVFRLFADGLYWACAACGRLTPFGQDDSLRPVPVRACHRCGATQGQPGRPEPNARLCLACPRKPVTTHASSREEWTLDDTRQALGMADRVLLEGDEGVAAFDRGLTAADRLQCADIHLAPHPLADAEPSVLIGCALGVPTIAPRFGALGERLANAAHLVPPGVTLHTSRSHVMGLMDVALGLEALVALSDTGARELAGHEVRARSSWWTPADVTDRWMQALEGLRAR